MPASLPIRSPLADSDPPPITVSGARRLDYIDGLRGLAMLMVLFYHCWERIGSWTLVLPFAHGHDFSEWIPYGRYGVHLFLLLSGFCLYYPLAKRGPSRDSEPTLAEFARRRAWRILPPYYASLAIFTFWVVLAKATGHLNWSPDAFFSWRGLTADLASHLVMLHNLFAGYVVSLNGPFWSLALECQLYVLFPLIAVALRKTSPRLVIFICFVICAAIRSAFIGDIYAGPNLGFVIGSSVFFRFFEFALGMYAARLVVEETPLRALWPDALFGLAVVGYVIHKHEMGYIAILTDPAWGILFFALLLSARHHLNWTHRALSQRRLVRLGAISYSVYLVHLPLAVVLGHWAVSLSLSGAALRVFSWLIAPPLLIGVGYAFHCVFERPFLQAGRRQKPAAPGIIS